MLFSNQQIPWWTAARQLAVSELSITQPRLFLVKHHRVAACMKDRIIEIDSR